ncbi:class I SAM-dependent methyltransferase [Hoeflea sp.]|uniref:class I SAM-dependent methyltransferase n=1 Tax=Hoeflea sp. TaxID=1940281 RepID=UPI003A8ED242
MNDIAKNLETWSKFDWDGDGRGGDRWSGGYGSPEAHWHFAIFPRIHRFFPAENVVEIAPSYGRWSQYLIPSSKKYVGIDLTPKCIDACRKRFGHEDHASFKLNDGLTLTDVKDNSVDFVYSLDSLVHCHGNVVESYVKEILRVLKDTGTAFIHHSNLASVPEAKSDSRYKLHWRAGDVSANTVRNMITNAGGTPYSQELVNWGDSPYLLDSYTIFGSNIRESQPYRRIENPNHMLEAYHIRSIRLAYCES